MKRRAPLRPVVKKAMTNDISDGVPANDAAFDQLLAHYLEHCTTAPVVSDGLYRAISRHLNQQAGKLVLYTCGTRQFLVPPEQLTADAWFTSIGRGMRVLYDDDLPF